MLHHRVHTSPQPFPIFSQRNRTHNLPLHSFNIHFNGFFILIRPMQDQLFQTGLLAPDFPKKSYMHLSLLLLCVQQRAPMSMERNCFIYLLCLSCFSAVLTRRTWIMKWKECRRINFSQFQVISWNFHGASEK